MTSRTSGFSKFRSGWWQKKRCQKYCPRTGSQVQLETSVSVKMMRASAYSSSVSLQTYQSSLPSSRRRLFWNQSWSAEVWFITRSAITRIPRWWAASRKALTSSIVP